ncbi:MAG TPA: hypothetical protein VFF35_02285, partial [Bacteroidia bacterium]|nr:hypothetical protein [Bacteroidia bacterium]
FGNLKKFQDPFWQNQVCQAVVFISLHVEYFLQRNDFCSFPPTFPLDPTLLEIKLEFTPSFTLTLIDSFLEPLQEKKMPKNPIS